MISQTYANKILNAMFGVSDAISLPTTLYLGLCANEPNASTGAVTGEPTAEGYARKAVGGSSATKLFGSASGGKITNTSEIQFATVRADAGKQNYFFISDSASGNAIAWGTLSGDITTSGITQNSVPTFFAGELEFTIGVAES